MIYFMSRSGHIKKYAARQFYGKIESTAYSTRCLRPQNAANNIQLSAIDSFSFSIKNRAQPLGFQCFRDHMRYSTATSASKDLPSEAEIVVCGGGVIGTSVALHLAEQGWKNVVLLEQGSLTCGTTWHSVGLVGRLKSGGLMIDMACRSRDLYKQLDEEGFHTGWKECGAIYLARTRDRLVAYTRYLQSAKLLGVEGEVITPEQVKELVPIIKTDDIQGAVWIPGDGAASAPDAAMAMARKAKQLGVKIMERTKVEMVHTDQGEVRSVQTDRGLIKCQVFVNCAGVWARDLGQLCDTPVRVPLHPCEHFYIVTKPIDGIDRMMPIVRDYDGSIYIREWSGGILGGGFEPVAKPVFHDGVPDGFEYQLLPEDWDHFQILLEQMLHRAPLMETAQVKQLVNGPESFTPDGKYIMGETPEVQNYFVAAGMNSSGITAAGGVGKYLAEWITHGEPSRECWSVDIRRFVDLHNNKKFLRDRVKETVGMESKFVHWEKEMIAYRKGRALRTSPLYNRAENIARFGQFMGYERPLYFKPDRTEDEQWIKSGMNISKRDFRSGSEDTDESSNGGYYTPWSVMNPACDFI